ATLGKVEVSLGDGVDLSCERTSSEVRLELVQPRPGPIARHCGECTLGDVTFRILLVDRGDIGGRSRFGSAARRAYRRHCPQAAPVSGGGRPAEAGPGRDPSPRGSRVAPTHRV